MLLLLSNKAVADGAISFYLDHRVSVRVARWTYGTNCAILFDSLDTEHRARKDTVITYLSGSMYVPNTFNSILSKVSSETSNAVSVSDFAI
jgi:hypothetical protein